MTKIHNTLSLPANDVSQRQKFSSKLSHVYVLQDEAGVIKIGHSANPAQRIKQIQRCCGLYVVRQHISPPCYNYRQTETALLTQFLNQTRQSEHLQATNFEEVCLALDKQEFQTALSVDPLTTFVLFRFFGHRIRIFVDKQGEVWFCLKDVCEALHIGNPSDVHKRVKSKGVMLVEVCDLDEIEVTSKARKSQKMVFVNEPNLYRVIFKSYKQEAVVFQDWVFEEVLPKIRQQGYYNLYGQTDPSIQNLVNDVAEKTAAQLNENFLALTQKPVTVAKAQKGTVTRVEVNFKVHLTIEVESS